MRIVKQFRQEGTHGDPEEDPVAVIEPHDYCSDKECDWDVDRLTILFHEGVWFVKGNHIIIETGSKGDRIKEEE